MRRTKCLLKKFGLERGVTRKILLEEGRGGRGVGGGLIFNRGIGNISKKGGFMRKG